MTRYNRAEDVFPGDYIQFDKQHVKVVRVERDTNLTKIFFANGKVLDFLPSDKVALLEYEYDEE